MKETRIVNRGSVFFLIKYENGVMSNEFTAVVCGTYDVNDVPKFISGTVVFLRKSDQYVLDIRKYKKGVLVTDHEKRKVETGVGYWKGIKNSLLRWLYEPQLL